MPSLKGSVKQKLGTMLLRVGELAEPSLAEGTWLNERCLGFLEKAAAELMRDAH